MHLCCNIYFFFLQICFSLPIFIKSVHFNLPLHTRSIQQHKEATVRTGQQEYSRITCQAATYHNYQKSDVIPLIAKIPQNLSDDIVWLYNLTAPHTLPLSPKMEIHYKLCILWLISVSCYNIISMWTRTICTCYYISVPNTFPCMLQKIKNY